MQGMKVRSLVRELRSHVCCDEDPAQPATPPERAGSQAHRASHLVSETPAPAKPHPQRSVFPLHGAAPLNSCVCVCVLVTQACLSLWRPCPLTRKRATYGSLGLCSSSGLKVTSLLVCRSLSLSNVYLFGCIGLSCSLWRLAP